MYKVIVLLECNFLIFQPYRNSLPTSPDALGTYYAKTYNYWHNRSGLIYVTFPVEFLT